MNSTETHERIISNSISKFGLSVNGHGRAETVLELVNVLSAAVAENMLIFIVGGLETTGRENLIRVLSASLSIPLQADDESTSSFVLDSVTGEKQPTLSGSAVFKNRLGGPCGFAIESGVQCIIGLPGSEAQLSDMLSGSAAAHFSRIYGLTKYERMTKGEHEPEIEISLDELDNVMEKTLCLSKIGDTPVFEEKEEKAVRGRKSISTKRVLIKIVITLLVISMIMSVFYVGYQSYMDVPQSGYQAKRVYSEVKQLYNETGDRGDLPRSALDKYAVLYGQNKDIGGWISIPGTALAYPVMIPPKDNTDYYETHDFYKSESVCGALYFDSKIDVSENAETINTVIYGHAQADGSMFSELNKYTDTEYLENHPLIQFDTLYEENYWRVFSVAIVSNDTLYEFNYTNNNFERRYSYEYHLYQLFIRSMFYTEVGVYPNDSILTLVTDANEFQGSKLIVCARKVRDDEELDNIYSGFVRNPYVLMPQIWYEMMDVEEPEVPEFEYAEEMAAMTSTTTTTTLPPTTATTKSKTTKTTKTTVKTTDNSSDQTATKTTEKETHSSDNVTSVSGLTMRITSKGKIIEGKAEDVLAKIVEAEMGGSYSEEALKAQAVAAYTFYLYSGGAAKAPSFPTKTATAKCKAAAKAVVGIKMTYDGKYPYACYTAISAGKTASNKIVNGKALSYLVSVNCSVDEKVSGFKTIKTHSASKVASRIKSKTGIDLSGMDKNEWFNVLSRDDTGLYVTKCSIGGKKNYSGAKIWSSILGYSYVRSPSFWITYNADDDTFTFESRGYGHCVGMSQKGANQYAKQGHDYQWILKHFYTGVKLSS